MKALLAAIVLALLLAGCGESQPPAVKATAVDRVASADADAGALVAERACKACHGVDGQSGAPGIPRLAAQRAPYVVASLAEYKSGARSHPAFKAMSNLSDADVRDVAAHYARLAATSATSSAPPAGAQLDQAAHDATEKCDRCHDANDGAVATPVIRGQDRDYLVASMRAYRDGTRGNGAMHHMSAAYGNVRIDDIASWYASLPVR
jgi:cytochrome c553